MRLFLSSNRSVRPPSIFAVCVLATIALACVITVQGNLLSLVLVLLHIPDFLVILLWLASALGWGVATLRLTRAPFDDWRLNIVLSIALGLGIESLLVLLIGLATVGSLVGWLIVIAGVLLAVFCRKYLAPSPGTAGEGRGEGDFERQQSSGTGVVSYSTLARAPLKRPPPRFLWLLPIAILTIDCLCALLPAGLLWGDEPNGYDVVEYHLQVPREWYELGRIVPLTHNVFSYFPFNVEMHYLLAIMLRHGPWTGMAVAQLMHVAMIALSVLAVYVLLAERSKWAATLAATAMAMTPWLALLGPVAYNEGGLLMWGTLAIGLLIRREQNWQSIALAGVMAGFACGSKWTGVPILFIAAPLAAAATRVITVRHVAIFWIAGIVVLSPWLVRNIAWSGNPVFPESTAIFGKAHWTDTQVTRWINANHRPPESRQNLSGEFGELKSQIIIDWRYDYLFLPIAFVAMLLAWHNPEAKALMLIALTLAVFWTFFTHLQSRFFVLIIPLGALLIGQVADEKPMRFLAMVLVIGLLGLTLMVQKLWSINGEVFKLMQSPDLIAFTPLGDQQLPSDPPVALIGDAHAYNYTIPMKRLSYRTVFDVNVQPGEPIISAWAEGSPIDAVRVVDPSELARFHRTYFGIPLPGDEIVNLPGPAIFWPHQK